MAAPDFTALVQAVVAKLRADAWLLANCPTVDSLQVTFAQGQKLGVVMKFPAVLVAYTGGPVRASGGEGFTQMARVRVNCAAKNYHGVAARHEAGALEVLARVVWVLSGQLLDGLADASELVPADMDPEEVAGDAGIASYSVDFELRLGWTIKVPDSDDLVTIQSTVEAGGAAEVDAITTLEQP